MKHNTYRPSFIATGMMAGMCAQLSAAVISWQSSVDMYDGSNSDAFVDNVGTSVIAVNPSSGSHGDITLNGVTFVAANLTALNGGVTSNGVTYTSTQPSQNGPTTFGDGAFSSNGDIFNVLSGASWSPGTQTFSGLTVGDTYSIQIFSNDARNGRNSNFVAVFSDGTQSVADSMAAGTAGFNQLDNRSPDNGSGNAGGDYIIGTFTADATTQSFDASGSTNGGSSLNSVDRAQINGIQLRNISVIPEPSSALLTGLAGLLFMFRRRQ